MKYEQLQNISDNRFRQAVGVNRATFIEMLEIIRVSYFKRHSRHNGRHRKLSLEDMLLATLEYLYEYRTFECIGVSYGLSKQNIRNTIIWVEAELISSGLFKLPGKKVLKQAKPIEVVLVDTTESPIQRPSRNQKRYYSGKKNGTP